MTIAELIKSIIDTSKERVKTPISGAFFLAFILYNWRPILFLLLSKTTIEYRIAIISKEYYSSWSFVIPLIIAISYSIIVPYIMFGIEKIVNYSKKERVVLSYVSRIARAQEEVKLQNARSENKEKEDFLNLLNLQKSEIKVLQESNQSIINSYTDQVNALNQRIKELIEENKMNMSKQEIFELLKEFDGTPIGSNVLLRDIRFLDYLLKNDNYLLLSPENEEGLIRLQANDLVEKVDKRYFISEKGKRFLKYTEILSNDEYDIKHL